jgi:signal transduction histidine kinase
MSKSQGHRAAMAQSHQAGFPNPEMLEQVLINLVRNSVEALGNTPDPLVRLSCDTDRDGHICLVVRDNGEGIPEDRLEQVFVPFYTTRDDGSGIGLSLCRQIVRLHGGKITIDSGLGEGTTIKLLL